MEKGYIEGALDELHPRDKDMIMVGVNAMGYYLDITNRTKEKTSPVAAMLAETMGISMVGLDPQSSRGQEVYGLTQELVNRVQEPRTTANLVASMREALKLLGRSMPNVTVIPSERTAEGECNCINCQLDRGETVNVNDEVDRLAESGVPRDVARRHIENLIAKGHNEENSYALTPDELEFYTGEGEGTYAGEKETNDGGHHDLT